jgi:hypothetical protein
MRIVPAHAQYNSSILLAMLSSILRPLAQEKLPPLQLPPLVMLQSIPICDHTDRDFDSIRQFK